MWLLICSNEFFVPETFNSIFSITMFHSLLQCAFRILYFIFNRQLLYYQNSSLTKQKKKDQRKTGNSVEIWSPTSWRYIKDVFKHRNSMPSGIFHNKSCTLCHSKEAIPEALIRKLKQLFSFIIRPDVPHFVQSKRSGKETKYEKKE